MTNKTKEKVYRWFEQLAMNYLLKRGYQVTLPKVYFSGKDYKAVGSATYWKPPQIKESK